MLRRQFGKIAFGAFLGGVARPHAIAAQGIAQLGTARTLKLGFTPPARYGRKSYPETLPLAPREVVLTFDDGPWPGTTERVLDALAARQTRATFFLIGRNAAAAPHLVRRIIAEGHTIANHSMTHPWTMRTISHERALADIRAGEAAITAAAGRAPAPFFRFPGFADTPALLDALTAERRIVLGADLWASDWNPMSPTAQLQLVMHRLRQAQRGILLFHDTKAQTAAMLPDFLRRLAEERYRVVHLVG